MFIWNWSYIVNHSFQDTQIDDSWSTDRWWLDDRCVKTDRRVCMGMWVVSVCGVGCVHAYIDISTSKVCPMRGFLDAATPQWQRLYWFKLTWISNKIFRERTSFEGKILKANWTKKQIWRDSIWPNIRNRSIKENDRNVL